MSSIKTEDDYDADVSTTHDDDVFTNTFTPINDDMEEEESAAPTTPVDKKPTKKVNTQADSFALIVELAKAGEKGEKINWEAAALKSGYANGSTARAIWNRTKKKYADGTISKDTSPLAPKANKVTKPRTPKKASTKNVE